MTRRNYHDRRRNGARRRQASSSQASPGRLAWGPRRAIWTCRRNGRPTRTWRAPQAPTDAGLARARDAEEIVPLERPTDESRLRPGRGDARSVDPCVLTSVVGEGLTLKRHRFPLVIGGDCSILLAACMVRGAPVGEDLCTSMDTAISSILGTTTRQSVWVRQWEWICSCEWPGELL